jgi:hypothetical protein
MRFYVESVLGDWLDDPSVEEMRRFLDEVDSHGGEHGAAWVATDSGFTLEWSGDGRHGGRFRRGCCPDHVKRNPLSH